MANPISPPTERPIRELKFANHADGRYSLLVSRESPLFQQNSPVKRGTKFSDLRISNQASQAIIDLHPAGLWFCEEIVPLRSSDVGGMPGERFVIWVFNTDLAAQSSTNAGITYSGDSVAHPIYARDYLIRRDAWEASQTIATLTALTALIGATITAAGTGYTFATGTVGTATLAAVCSGGAIIAWIVTKDGSGITNGAAITITGDGTGATATAVIQPATAVLVAQNKQELPEDSNLSKEFVLVQRVYETLPGPWIYDVREDLLLGLVQLKKRAVAVTTPPQTGSTTATTKTVYQAREDSSVVAWEIVETFTDGTGSAGNPAFPIIERDPYDDERGPIHGTEQLVTDTGQVSSLVESGGIVTLTTYEPYNEFLKKKVVETWAVTGPEHEADPYDDDRGAVDVKTQLVIDNNPASSISAPSTTATKIEYQRYSKVQLRKVTETWTLPGPRIDKISYPYGTVGRRVESRRSYSRAVYLAAGRTANGTAHPDYASALLVDELYDGGNEAVGFLVQTFDQIPAASDQQGLGYSLSYPEGDTAFPRLVWRYKAPRIGLAHPVHGAACPITSYTTLVCSDVKTHDINDAEFQVEVEVTYEILPGKTVTDAPQLDADGSIVTRTRQRVVRGTVTAGESNTGTVLTLTTEEALSDYVSVKVVESRVMAGFLLTDHKRDAEVRGRTVDIYRQKALTGSLAIESGNLILSSQVRQLSVTVDERISQKVASLPPDESWAFWDFVPLPLLIFDINHTVFCNGTPSYKLTTAPDKSGGASALRKHRVTVSYSNTYPNPDLSGSTYAVGSISYEGKVINFSYGNVLNDALSVSTLNGNGECTWTEAYSFSASTPSATTFAAGAWYVREFRVEPVWTGAFKSTKIEFYSAEGNPSI